MLNERREYVDIHREDTPLSCGATQRRPIVHFPGVGRDHLAGKCIDPAPAACRALCARLEDAESVCVMPMTAEVLATQCFGAADAAQRAAEHTDNMRRFAHIASVSGGLARLGSHVPRRGSDQTAAERLLAGMSDPPARSAGCKDAGQCFAGKAERLEEEGGVELEIGLQRSPRLVAREDLDGGTLDRFCEPEPRGIETTGLRQHVECPLDRIRARVSHPVDPMPETHQPLAARQRGFQPGLCPPGMTDGIEHIEHRTRRAAVQRTFECAERTDQRGSQSGGWMR
jgi:hypothetical protein